MLKLIEKLQRILAMTESPNVNEAAVAAAKAAELMAAYNLNFSDLREVGQGGGEHVRAFFLDAEHKEDWRKALASKVAQYSFCDYMAWDKRRNMQHVFVGETHNIAAAIVLYEYLRDSCFKAHEARSLQERTRNSFLSFASGFTTRVLQRLEERMKETFPLSATPNAVMIYGGLRRIKGEQNAAFIEANFGGEEKLPVKGITDDLDAFHAGVRVGDKIGLDKQIKQNTMEKLK